MPALLKPGIMSPLGRLFSQHRISVSRVFGIVFVVALLATGSMWQGTLVGRAMFLAGILLAAIGMVGRIWCLTYSSGYKSSELVTQGPYSVCRNPLYFFSFVGLVGIGLATETLSLTLFLMAFFIIVYPAVIVGEEEFLLGRFGQAYAGYCDRTPRFFPRRSLFAEPESYTVQPRTLRRSLGGVIWFIGLPVAIQVLVSLRTAGVIGSLTLLP
jgi:protein-S-isoprenylcysteine O-methyltransferase Ste14